MNRRTTNATSSSRALFYNPAKKAPSAGKTKKEEKNRSPNATKHAAGHQEGADTEPRWRAPPPASTSSTSSVLPSSADRPYLLDLVERWHNAEVRDLVLLRQFLVGWSAPSSGQSAGGDLPFAGGDAGEYSAVPRLARLCQASIIASEESFRAHLPLMRFPTADAARSDAAPGESVGSLLPTELRNGISSAALARGYISTEREALKLLLHSDTEELNFSHPNCRQIVTDAFVRKFLPHVPIIKDMNSWEDITLADLYLSPQGCPLLSRISFAGCFTVSSSLIKDVLKSFAHLSVLDLSFMDIDIVRNITIESATLTQLIMTNVRGTRPSLPLRAKLATPSLRHLSLRGTRYIGEIKLLEKVHNDTSTTLFPTAPSLQILDFSGVCLRLSNLNESKKSFLDLCRQHAGTLNILNLASCDVTDSLLVLLRSLSRESVPPPSLHRGLPSFSLELEEVSLAGNKNLSSDAIRDFVNDFSPSLRLLDISRCDLVPTHMRDAIHSIIPNECLCLRV